MKSTIRSILFLLSFLWSLNGNSQPDDTLSIIIDTADVVPSREVTHSPRKASIYSSVLPGLGQIYNKKYWKVPIVYAGFAGLGYGVYYNATGYEDYKKTYKYMVENGLDEYEGQSFREVEWYKNTHRRYRDLYVIMTAGFYVLQVIDATVDAHLFDYDISDDLSFKIDPVFLTPSSEYKALGLRCCLFF